jgi:hypothetical protein
MEKLYIHTLEKQKREIETLKADVEALKAESKAASLPGPPIAATVTEHKHVNVVARHASVDQSTGKTVTNISINVFEGENTAHITPKDIWGLLQKLGPLGENLRKSAERLILSTAMMIFSDERHPENITCYLPNKKGKDALIHGERGWEVMPVSLTLSPMASKSVDTLFKKQPWPGLNGVPADLNLDEPTRILRYIADNEPDLVGDAASPSSELRAIPIRNREILEKVLARLPRAGDA